MKSKWSLFLTGLILVLALCLPSCSSTNKSTATGRVSDKPYTPPKEYMKTSKTPTDLPGQTDQPRDVKLDIVAMPPDMTGRISSMLKAIPLDAPARPQSTLNFVDYAAWCQTLGLDRNDYRDSQGGTNTATENFYIEDFVISPFDSGDSTGLLWLPWLGHSPFISGMGIELGPVGDQETLKKLPIRSVNIGYGPLDVDRSILSLTFYQGAPVFFEAIQGVFKTGAIAQAAGNFQDGVHSAIVSSRDGFTVYSWDNTSDTNRSLHAPAFDAFGQGATLAVQPFDILGSQQPALVDVMIDAYRGKVKNAADDPWFAELARRMESMGAMSTLISDWFLVLESNPNPTDRMSIERAELFNQAALTAPLLGPYLAHAVGLGVDEKGMFVAVALLYDSPDLAKMDIGTLEYRLAEGYNMASRSWRIEVESHDIWSEGNFLCAKLRGKVTSYWSSFIGSEPLLVRASDKSE